MIFKISFNHSQCKCLVVSVNSLNEALALGKQFRLEISNVEEISIYEYLGFGRTTSLMLSGESNDIITTN